jgi:hypothetical protein
MEEARWAINRAAQLLEFSADLLEAVEQGRSELLGLGQAGAVYRADALFEAGADLSDALVGVEHGRLGEDVARTEALRVCRLAVLLWLSVVGEDEEDGR